MIKTGIEGIRSREEIANLQIYIGKGPQLVLRTQIREVEKSIPDRMYSMCKSTKL